MKSRYPVPFKTILILVLLSGLTLGLAACGQSSQNVGADSPANSPVPKTTASPLTVLSINGGEVLVLKPGAKEWVRGEAGITLDKDYKVKTAADGQATVTFFEGSTIELKGNTEVGLAQLGMTGAASDIQIEQTLGETISRVKKLADPASRYEIETPAAVAAVRGTTLYVGVAKEGTTNVGNIEGLVAVTAQGVESMVPVDNHITVVPGSPPGEPQPGATVAPPAAAPASTTATPTVTPSPTPTITEVAKLDIATSVNLKKVYPGDTIIYNYTIGNSGEVPLSGISITDNYAGTAAYVRGDTNNDKILDAGESWILSASYVAKVADVGQLTSTATVTGTSPLNKTATASYKMIVTVEKIEVSLTSFQSGSASGLSIPLSGTVNDPSIKEAVLTVNGTSTTLVVTNSTFSATVNLTEGITNTIEIKVFKTKDITASYKVDLVPSPGS
jgi:hypothetical protein